MAEATGDYTGSALSARDKRFLRDLPTFASREVEGTKFFLCHATPSDYLWEYRPPDSPLWQQDEAASSGAGVEAAGWSGAGGTGVASTRDRWESEADGAAAFPTRARNECREERRADWLPI
jgi:hypothetical protein